MLKMLLIKPIWMKFFFQIDRHFCFLEKYFTEFKLHYNQQIVEEILIQTATKTIIQTLHERSLFDSFPNTIKVLKDFMFVTRRRSK